MELGIVEGLFDMCEKFFGPKLTKLLGGLIVITIVCMCLVFIVGDVVVPIIRFATLLVENKESITLTKIQVVTDIAAASLSGLILIGSYAVCMSPVFRQLRNIQKKITIVEEDARQAQREHTSLTEEIYASVTAYVKFIEIVNDYNKIRKENGLEPIEVPENPNDEAFSKLLEIRNRLSSRLESLIGKAPNAEKNEPQRSPKEE